MKHKSNISSKNKLPRLSLAVLSFALFAVFGLSLITGNQQDSGVGSSLASAEEPADINSDAVVDIVDLSILLSNWSTTDSLSDINNDNVVDIVDLSVLLSKWGAVNTREFVWPNATNTGVPAGTTLTPSGGLTITTPGTVIEEMHVNGSITIEADNVTIRRTLVQSAAHYRINIKGGTTGTVIEDVEIDAMNSPGKGMLIVGSATIRRVDIHGSEDGIFVLASEVLIEDSYIHHLYRTPEGHIDCFQIRKGDNVTLRGNNLQAYNVSTNDLMNSSIQVGSLEGTDQISNFLVEGNLMNGGNYTINGGGRGETDSSLYRNNRFGRDYRYGVVGNLNSGDIWESSNVWQDTENSI